MISIVAPAFPVDRAQLDAGLVRLAAHGIEPRVHPQTFLSRGLHAGTDAQRAEALWEAANDPETSAVWAARGGCGCTRLLPHLEQQTGRHGPPPTGKLLVGYSDLPALFGFVHDRWGWRTLHANMPAAAGFDTFDGAQLDATLALIRGDEPGAYLEECPLRLLAGPHRDTGGPIVGGNLATLNYLTGTPWQPDLRGRLLFLEDVGEPLHKLDAFVNQLDQAGVLSGCAGVLLGGFDGCGDGETPIEEALASTWSPIAERRGLPIWAGLPVTHGPTDFWPLPLHVPHRISGDGILRRV